MNDIKVRKLITCHRTLHPRTVIDRLYIRRENGRRGLIQQELTYNYRIKDILRHYNRFNQLKTSRNKKYYIDDNHKE